MTTTDPDLDPDLDPKLDPKLDPAPTGAGVDLERAERAAREFLLALGMDLGRDGRDRTPGRMARAYAELVTPRAFEATTFANDEGYDELVVVDGVDFVSVCEHHLLPFMGKAAVGYLPGDRIVGLSKLARVVELFSRAPQVQERLTAQIASWLERELAPRGVGVVLVAEHSCMTLRGAKAAGSVTTTSAMRGLLRDDLRTRAEFLALVRGR
ncbi:MAG: GTP cyclohydrolase I FolE [Kineosporiaceae bacterium]